MHLDCCYSKHAKVVSMLAVVGQYGLSTVKAENRDFQAIPGKVMNLNTRNILFLHIADVSASLQSTQVYHLTQLNYSHQAVCFVSSRRLMSIKRMEFSMYFLYLHPPVFAYDPGCQFLPCNSAFLFCSCCTFDGLQF